MKVRYYLCPHTPPKKNVSKKYYFDLFTFFQKKASPEEATADHSHSHHHSHDKNEGLDSAVALSLLFGFIFMLLVDQLASSRHR